MLNLERIKQQIFIFVSGKQLLISLNFGTVSSNIVSRI